MQKLTIEDLKERLRKDLARDVQGNRLLRIVAGVLSEKWDGKAINARIVGHVEAALSRPDVVQHFPPARPDLKPVPIVSYDPSTYSDYQLRIYNVPEFPDYRDAFTCYLGADFEPTTKEYQGHHRKRVVPAGFLYANACWGRGAESRIPVLEKLIQNDAALTAALGTAERIRQDWQALEDCYNEPTTAPIYYMLKEYTGLDLKR